MIRPGRTSQNNAVPISKAFFGYRSDGHSFQEEGRYHGDCEPYVGSKRKFIGIYRFQPFLAYRHTGTFQARDEFLEQYLGLLGV